MGQDFTLFPETSALVDVGFAQPSVRDDMGQVHEESFHLERLHSLLYLEGTKKNIEHDNATTAPPAQPLEDVRPVRVSALLVRVYAFLVRGLY